MMDMKEAVLRYQTMIAERLEESPYISTEVVLWVNDTPMFAATINGIRMVNKKGKVRLFRTTDAAKRAARKGVGI